MNKENKIKVLKDKFSVIEKLGDMNMLSKVFDIWIYFWDKSSWTELDDCPFNPALPEISLVNHVNCVLEMTLSMADILKKYNPDLNFSKELLIYGSLLHDVSKLIEIKKGPDNKIRFSSLLKKYPHATLGGIQAKKRGFSLHVVNMIMSHTVLTGVKPLTPEAVLLHYVDYGMADILSKNSRLPLLMDGKNAFGKN